MLVKRYFSIEPIASTGRSAAAYVPWVLVSRGLSFVRFFLVVRILGEVGREQYGLYRPALELINPLVALLLFGAADVAERYASRVERELGAGGLWRWLIRTWARLLGMGLLTAAGLAVVALLAGRWVWGAADLRLALASGVTLTLLAIYQHIAATLRGLRAYAAAAGMEILAAVLLLALSVVGAMAGQAWVLMLAYAGSVLIPGILFGALLWRYGRAAPAALAGGVPTSRPMTAFAAWSLVRLILVMLFGFLSLWGVRFLAGHQPGPAESELAVAADFGMVFTIAQLLAYAGVTLWSSSYGIAATAWSHGQVRRAKATFFRTGRLGAALLAVGAITLVLTRGIAAAVLPPPYRPTIEQLLPGMTGVFMGYALLAFASGYADLQEKPWRGALLWAIAVSVQVWGIVLGVGRSGDMRGWMLVVLAIAVGLPLTLSPLVVGRLAPTTATGLPMAVIAVSAASLMAPVRIVTWLAPAVMAASVLILFFTGLLVRPLDRRSFRAFLRRH